MRSSSSSSSSRSSGTLWVLTVDRSARRADLNRLRVAVLRVLNQEHRRNVTIVVLVLITSCQVSLYPKSGPVRPQTTMIPAAAGTPRAGRTLAVHLAKRVNADVDRVGRMETPRERS